MEASYEGGQGLEGAVVPWMDGWTSCVLTCKSLLLTVYKACPSESGIKVGAPLFPAVELCNFPGRWQCMSGEIWYTLDSGSVLLTEAEGR